MRLFRLTYTVSLLLYTSIATATIIRIPQEQSTIQVRVLYSHPDEQIHPFRQNDLMNGKPFHRLEPQPPFRDEILSLDAEHKQDFEQNRNPPHKSSLFKVNDSGSLWGNYHKYIYTYDSNGNLTEKLEQHRRNNEWLNHRKYIYTYDANGNLTEWLRQSWDANNKIWVNYWLYTYTYDITGNMMEELSQYWHGNAWVNNYKYTFTYDTIGNMTEWLRQSWDKDNNSWINREREIYTNDTYGNMTEQMRQEFENNIWLSWWKTTFIYDTTDGNMTAKFYHMLENNIWICEHKETFIYNTTGNLTEWLYQHWDDESNDWRSPYEVHTYTYDANGNMTEELEQRWDWDNEELVNNWKETYNYDENGNLTERLSKEWYSDKNVWVNDWKYTYTYDVNGNLAEEFGKSWEYSIESRMVIDGRKDDLRLSQNYPNPFNSLTTFHFSIPQRDFVSIKVYNILGKEITTLVNEVSLSGNHPVFWSGNNQPSGVYLIRMEYGDFTQVRKVMVVR